MKHIKWGRDKILPSSIVLMLIENFIRTLVNQCFNVLFMESYPISVQIGWRRRHLNSSWIEFKLIRINSSPAPTFHQIVPNFHFLPSSKVQTSKFQFFPIPRKSHRSQSWNRLSFKYIFYFTPFREHFFSFCLFLRFFICLFNFIFYLVFFFKIWHPRNDFSKPQMPK